MFKFNYKSYISKPSRYKKCNGLATLFALIFVVSVACNPVSIEPIQFPRIEENSISKPVKIVVLSNSDTILKYSLFYNSATEVEKINEAYWVTSINKYDTSFYELKYNKSKINFLKCSTKVDLGIYGRNLPSSYTYSFFYDSLNALNKVSLSSIVLNTSTKSIQVIPTKNSLNKLYLGNYNNGELIDTLKEITDTSTHLIYQKTNSYIDYVYEKNNPNIVKSDFIGHQSVEIQQSTLDNNLPIYLWPLIQKFIDLEGDFPNKKHYSLLNPDPYFYFNGFIKDAYSTFPYRYNSAHFTYVLNNSNQLESIRVTSQGSVKTIKFYY